MAVSKDAQQLLESLFRELVQSERQAMRHARIEAERFGQNNPGVIMDETAVHAERAAERIEELARQRDIVLANGGSAAGRALANLRDRLAELAATKEQSYRMTLLGLRHSVDVIRLVRELSVSAADRELQEWCERWSLRRLDLLEQAEGALSWLAEHPERALQPVKSTLVAQMTRTVLKAVGKTEPRAHAG